MNKNKNIIVAKELSRIVQNESKNFTSIYMKKHFILTRKKNFNPFVPLYNIMQILRHIRFTLV